MNVQPVDVGILSLVPPVIAITLALLTKEVISSLVLGILSGGLIYSLATGASLVEIAAFPFEVMAKTVGTPDKFNIILFLALLGALVCVVTRAGGSQAYGQWATKHIKSKRSAELATSFLGILIFIDDYFNCLTVGTVMKPVTDKYRISRAKLAYIIDTTAAPVCIIAPVSSWAAAVGSTLYETGAFSNELSAFFATIPYNMYAILSIFMVMALSFTDLEFGPMADAEWEAEQTGNVGAVDQGTDTKNPMISSKGTVWDLIIPIGGLIVFTILAMIYNGGYWAKDITLQEAIGNCNSSAALVLGGFLALVLAFLMFVPRKLIGFRDFMSNIGAGINTMVPAYIILCLAWTIGSLCQNYLGTGKYIGMLVQTSHLPIQLIPAIVFLVAAGLSFSIGTAWGTFGIFIPIVVFICKAAPAQIMTVTLAATLAGSVFGDHCSPISDTTILSSSGAGCEHIKHVSTQIPYAVVVAFCCLISYLVAGFSGGSAVLTIAAGIIMLLVTLTILHKRARARLVKK
ncbi:MAG: Na+/H+ antiporter NhaC family protein [Acidaminococcus sp.]|jgi:Na+/H+ antiporter NhaC|nr:Na+/H+ antiporter NhaC family protein [Acidaminococcus sp.]MCI2099572.1 Na+/H+ antiporter NhaC family protein [Acidaminococcus sp.]MCI2113657.1 Na+/H+ antiporter NhaC family protein [Acidaminococcus sp.]MCI2115740.1 Na+/H+ antiporter NhaC family protein [Acidaminococcus sp.]